MEIYLIRHTTPQVEKGICYGQTDLDLIENFQSEFETVTSKLPQNENISVFSSPLKRCTQLADTLSNQVILDNRLKELNFGEWELKPWNDIPETEINPWMEDFVSTAVPNGESYTELASRVRSFFQALLILKTQKNVVIVSHAGPIRAFLAQVLDIPLKDSFKIKINYGDVFHLRLQGKSFELLTEVGANS
ncbi:alpha-ribazole phosphatase [Pseudotamlana carrageenivorans]|uniref:Alpha-ribazole phosphatase n=1 Tax=Pseudotamlana carrageenivorans TaxID=2069432 RepID=A0A2I7SE56_9FLAO|nr:alpha-ribazole phosphatase [Tamlana carrageenivorans]AUS04176.1 alpha-ribazole phosphatase [Tamlana carrageenivorans]